MAAPVSAQMKLDRKSVDVEVHNPADDVILSKIPQGYEHRKLPADPGARMTPEDVFQYANVDTWRDRVWNMLGDLITEDVKVNFQRNHPEYITSDDLSWLDDIIFDVTGVFSDIKTTAADRLSMEFTVFRAAHATRTDDLGRFYAQGLRILSNREIEDRARALFLNG